MTAVGRLFRARGNRGELIGEIYSSRPGRAEKLKEVVLELPDGKTRQATVERVWFHDGRPVFKFFGIDSISDAEPWAGADILVADSERDLPGDGEYSHADLLGCALWNGAVKAGVVRGVEDFGGGPLLDVKLEDGREVLVPFARAICKEIDVAAKRIQAELPEGLLD
ncbi:MAG TPA: ribosome maturation factor RimM [Bryobacteraceae bacterium]|nr:ribosome maturation factor RimM [Bryobacteraceae bacterium]